LRIELSILHFYKYYFKSELEPSAIIYLILLYSSDEKPPWFPIYLNVVFHLYYNNSRAKFLRVIGEIVNFTLLLNQREIYIIIRWYYYRSLRKTRRLLSRKGYSVVIGQASYQNYKLNRYGTPLYYYIIHVLNSAVFNRLRCVFPAFCGYSHTQLWCRRFDCGCNIIAISPITRRPEIALPRLY